MTLRHKAMATLMVASITAQAQFVVETDGGESTVVKGRGDAVFTPATNGGWTFGGIDIGKISSLTVQSAEQRLADYEAPAYPDYYRSISGWDTRAQWNLANVHDPSVVRAADGYYYMFTTDASFGNSHSGHGHFMCRRSRNLIDWEFLGATMPTLPAWVKPKLNEIRAAMGLEESPTDFTDDTQFGYWAPCVRMLDNGIYRMYYAITCPGYLNGDGTWGERAFIGMMETTDIADVSSWQDKGYVLTNVSDKQLEFNVPGDDWANCYYKWNAIDPSYIITPEGEHWLIYGSWHSGFAAVRLDAQTGMPQKELGMPWGDDISAYGELVYTRQMGNRWQAAEAPEVVYHDGYYYLFMAYDELSVAYNTRVVRSRNIDGPYYGIDGTDVTGVGGDAYPLLTHPYRFSEGYGWVGISHCAVFNDGQGNWFYSSQGRLPGNAYGDIYSNAIMQGQVRRILWTAEGWPLVMPECYGGVPQTPITEDEIVG
ncbi:MAG: family 43 glycosylhydrolase, partial [Prevotella sp.]